MVLGRVRHRHMEQSGAPALTDASTMPPPIWPEEQGRPLPSGVITRGLVLGGLRDAGAGHDAQSSDQRDRALCGQLPTVSRRELSEPSGLHRGLPAEGVRADLRPGRPEIGPVWLDESRPRVALVAVLGKARTTARI
jgi:hypothetical protein